MIYYQVDAFPLDKTILGKYDMPHTIRIESKNFLNYISERNRNIKMYFENKNTLYEKMPDNLQGKLLKRKNVIDFMDFSPFCLSLLAVVSNKMKQILEKLNVSKDEYVLKRISIKGFYEDFYLLFVPIIQNTEFVYSKCIFIDRSNRINRKIYNNREEYLSDPQFYDYSAFKITLNVKYSDYDLLWPQGCGCLFSERIVNAMREENIVGYAITKEGGYFYQELYFASE